MKKKPTELPSEVACFYCHKLTKSGEFLVNPKALNEFYCCGEDCYDKTNAFIKWDNKTRTPFYFTLILLVVANLLLIAFKIENRFVYLPMLGIGAVVFAIPSVFARYERYQPLGLFKTQRVIRVFAAAIILFSLLQIILY